jgi:hypothetical protein
VRSDGVVLVWLMGGSFMRAKFIILLTAAMLVLSGALMPAIVLADKGGVPHQGNNRGSCDPEDFLEYIECLTGYPN